MSDPEITPAAPSEPETVASPPKTNPDQPSANNLSGISFSIWPPTQRTRDAVINRLIETLSTPSILSKRYGTMPADEASAAARQIEDEAFASAGGSAASDVDGIEILQVYSKEISKRMLESVKARATAVSAAADNGATDVAPSVSPVAEEEDVPAAADSET